VRLCARGQRDGAIGASAASAQTFFVDQRGGSSTCLGGGTFACGTIKEAIVQAEKLPGPNTIEVQSNEEEEGLYKEAIVLNSSKDKGLTINGFEPGVRFSTTGINTVNVGAAAGAVTLSNLGIVANGAAAVRDAGAELTLVGDSIEDESGAGPTLIVSPLLALMRNQITAAQRLGLRAHTINSTNREEWDDVRDRLASEHPWLALDSHR
jgi:hypothetical protein